MHPSCGGATPPSSLGPDMVRNSIFTLVRRYHNIVTASRRPWRPNQRHFIYYPSTWVTENTRRRPRRRAHTCEARGGTRAE
eukprot:1737047-Prymnesium_polylepis.1